MTLAALGALGNALIPSGAQSSELAKDHAQAARFATTPQLPPANPGGQAPAAAEPSLTALRLATHEVERAVRAQASSLSFSIDQSSGSTIVRVTDSETGQVLRRIPAQEMLSLSRAISKMQGLLLSQRA